MSISVDEWRQIRIAQSVPKPIEHDDAAYSTQRLWNKTKGYGTSSSWCCIRLVVHTTRVQTSVLNRSEVSQLFEKTMTEVPTEYLSWRRTTSLGLPAIDLPPLAGTKKKFPELEQQMTQVRKRGSLESPGQPRTNVKCECGIAMKVVMLTGEIGEQREAIATKLAHGIHDDTLFCICIYM